tara:strand:+ start:1498 stop:1917 length:420 start_codon:yes stop_codon:yes gene_type:complete
LATKYTRKKQNYNKKHLAKKLDDLSNKVAKRGVYVVRPAKPGFNIINYINNEVYVYSVPFKNTAKSICKILNDKNAVSKPSSERIQKECDQFYKHFNDIHFYKYTIKTTKIMERRLIAQTRMDESVGMLKNIRQKLSYY